MGSLKTKPNGVLLACADGSLRVNCCSGSSGSSGGSVPCNDCNPPLLDSYVVTFYGITHPWISCMNGVPYVVNWVTEGYVPDTQCLWRGWYTVPCFWEGAEISLVWQPTPGDPAGDGIWHVTLTAAFMLDGSTNPCQPTGLYIMGFGDFGNPEITAEVT